MESPGKRLVPSRPASGVLGRPQTGSSPRTLPALVSQQEPGPASTSKHSADEERELLSLQFKFQGLDKRYKQEVEALERKLAANKDALAALKEEGRELKRQLACHRGAVDKTPSARVIEALEKQVHEARSGYDKLVRDKATAVAKLGNLQEELAELARAASAGAGGGAGDRGGEKGGEGGAAAISLEGLAMSAPGASRLRQLQNRLDKAMTKYNEAMSIQATYQQVADRLQKDTAVTSSQLKVLEQALQARERELGAQQEALRAAEARRSAALAELAAQQKAADREWGAADRLLHQQGGGAGGLGVAPSQAAEEAEEEEAMQTLQPLFQATGAQDLPSLVEVLLQRHAAYMQWQEQCAAAGRQLEELRGEVARLQDQFESLTEAAAGQPSTQQLLEAAQAQLQAASEQHAAAAERYQHSSREFMQVKAALDTLMTLCQMLPSSKAKLAVNDETAVNVVAQCYERLTAAQAQIREVTPAAAMLDDLVAMLNDTFAVS